MAALSGLVNLSEQVTDAPICRHDCGVMWRPWVTDLVTGLWLFPGGADSTLDLLDWLVGRWDCREGDGGVFDEGGGLSCFLPVGGAAWVCFDVDEAAGPSSWDLSVDGPRSICSDILLVAAWHGDKQNMTRTQIPVCRIHLPMLESTGLGRQSIVLARAVVEFSYCLAIIFWDGGRLSRNDFALFPSAGANIASTAAESLGT